MVFVRNNGSRESIYIANANGTNPVQLSEGDNPDWEPAPS
jgi:hypothetical protein